jgi:hypothetical protein
MPCSICKKSGHTKTTCGREKTTPRPPLPPPAPEVETDEEDVDLADALERVMTRYVVVDDTDDHIIFEFLRRIYSWKPEQFKIVEEPLENVSGESSFSVKIFGDNIFSSQMKVYGIIRYQMFIPDRITLYKHQREYKWELDRRIPGVTVDV